jgi:hypothetical protein
MIIVSSEGVKHACDFYIPLSEIMKFLSSYFRKHQIDIISAR